jgi:hypothetical protein
MAAAADKAPKAVEIVTDKVVEKAPTVAAKAAGDKVVPQVAETTTITTKKVLTIVEKTPLRKKVLIAGAAAAITAGVIVLVIQVRANAEEIADTVKTAADEVAQAVKK